MSLFAQSVDEVKIGNQIWMTKNLNLDKFRNGEPIPQAKTEIEWKQASENKQPAWCYYNNDPRNGEKYGKLYNWYAVNDKRGLAPDGWNIPSENEWKGLDFIDHHTIRFLKDTCGWKKNCSERFRLRYPPNCSEITRVVDFSYGFGVFGNGNGNNCFGFSALPGGSRRYDGVFENIRVSDEDNREVEVIVENIGYEGLWWTSEESASYDYGDFAWMIGVNYKHKEHGSESGMEKGCGLSVRCVKNLLKNKTILNKNVSLISKAEVKIGNQIWATKNLNVDKFRNGEPIIEAKTDAEWQEASKNKQPAWCCYNFDPANCEKYGKLYNWYAVNDSRGLAPEGWHIPNDDEWTVLDVNLGFDAGNKMKSTIGWSDYVTRKNLKINGNGTNESFFMAMPAGFCLGDESCFFAIPGSDCILRCNFIGEGTAWWSKTEFYSDFDTSRFLKNSLMFTGYALYRSLSFEHVYLSRGVINKVACLSVRCIKD